LRFGDGILTRPPYRIRREVEPRYVAEYVSKTYPDRKHAFRVPLGTVPKSAIEEMGLEKALRFYRSSRSEADAVVWLPREILLIEGKVWKPFDGPKSLLLYRTLVPRTPDIGWREGMKVTSMLLCPVIHAALKESCTINDITPVEYMPDWIRPIWEEHDRYTTREWVERRALRRKRMEAAGIE